MKDKKRPIMINFDDDEMELRDNFKRHCSTIGGMTKRIKALMREDLENNNQ